MVTPSTKVVKTKNKRRFLVTDSKDNIDYTIKVKSNKKGHEVYKLYYSDSEVWRKQVRGELRIKMTNTGNEMVIDIVDKSDLSVLDYAELEALRILMNLEREISDEVEHKIIEV